VTAVFIAVATPLMQVPWTFGLAINLIAFLNSGLIGVVFGFFPARRTVSLNPIDALGHEQAAPGEKTPASCSGGEVRLLLEVSLQLVRKTAVSP
jgi:hypothetical protein